MIVVIGDRIDDVYLHYRATRSSHGQQVVVRDRTETMSGGAAATAEMCRALGVETVFVSSDVVSVKVRHVVDGNVVFREDSDHYTDSQQALKVVREADPVATVVILSDYGKGMITREVIETVARWDVMMLVDPYPGVPPDRYRGVSLCCPNWDAYLAGEKQWSTVRPLCVKMDSRGALLWHGDQATLMPPVPVKMVDSCGAGDQWIAALAVSLHGGATLLRAIRWANRAAAIKCTRQGTVPVQLNELGRKVGIGVSSAP